MNCDACDIRLENADILSNLESKVSHLEPSQQSEFMALLKEFEYLFGDEPGKTDLTCHDVDVGQAKPIEQQPYRLNPHKLKRVCKKIKYMLYHKFIEPSQTEWSSPVLLVPKLDGSQIKKNIFFSLVLIHTLYSCNSLYSCPTLSYFSPNE